MAAGLNNKNAEKWTVEETESVFDKAILLSMDDEYDFIGEIARDLQISRHTFTYLSGKYPELQQKYDLILSNLEANCFKHTKKETINVATGIVNLKSNYKWTDRQQVDTNISVNEDTQKAIRTFMQMITDEPE